MKVSNRVPLVGVVVTNIFMSVLDRVAYPFTITKALQILPYTNEWLLLLSHCRQCLYLPGFSDWCNITAAGIIYNKSSSRNWSNWGRGYENGLTSNTSTIIILKDTKFPPTVLGSVPQNASIFELLIIINITSSLGMSLCPSIFIMCHISRWKGITIRWSLSLPSKKSFYYPSTTSPNYWSSPKVAYRSSLPAPSWSVSPYLYIFASVNKIGLSYQVLGGALVCRFASCVPFPNYSTPFHPCIIISFVLFFWCHTLPHLISFSETTWKCFPKMLTLVVLTQFSESV